MGEAVFSRIVVPTDFSPCSEAAWAVAQRLAGAFGSELILLHALVEPALWGPLRVDRARELYDSARQWATQMLENWAEDGRGKGLTVRLALRSGVPWQEIVDVASERADLVVIGTYGRHGMNRLLLGSVADRVVRLAPCPVLTVRKRIASSVTSCDLYHSSRAARGR
jgi:nucleotide-binding universal stress UspA family protein